MVGLGEDFCIVLKQAKRFNLIIVEKCKQGAHTCSKNVASLSSPKHGIFTLLQQFKY